MLLVPEVQLLSRTVRGVLVTRWCEPPGGKRDGEGGSGRRRGRKGREKGEGIEKGGREVERGDMIDI